MTQPTLSRRLGLWLTLFYGLGTIIGAGIYVLVGKVAGTAGLATPFSFLLAAVLAGLSGLSYAELATRYPRSGGEAIYLEKAMGLRYLSIAVGFLVVLSGTFSPATLLNGFVGYFQVFFDWPPWIVMVTLAILTGSVAAWGIKESAVAVTVITLAEITGLALILFLGWDDFWASSISVKDVFRTADVSMVMGVMMGALIAFYAFIGFEDMANIAGEVKNPSRNLPLAIILALIISTFLYLSIATLAVATMDQADLLKTDAPMAMMYEKFSGKDPWIVGIIGLVSIVNGILVQMIMATRALYGMASEKWIPAFLGRVHPKTKTPLLATVLVTAAIIIAAVGLPSLVLAKIASFIVLLIFTLVNLALWNIKRKEVSPPAEAWIVWGWVPKLGFISNAAFLLFQVYQLIFGAGPVGA